MTDTLPPLLLARLNHVGIACLDIDAAIAMYARLFGATVSTPPFDVSRPSSNAAVIFLQLMAGN